MMRKLTFLFEWFAEKGRLSHAEEAGHVAVHFDNDGKPLFVEILRASKTVPLMVQGLAKK